MTRTPGTFAPLLVAALTCFGAASPAASQEAVLQALEPDGLGQMLTQLGYTVEREGDAFEVEAEREGWTFPLRFFLSSGKTVVWVTVYLRDIAPEEATPGLYEELLVQNDAIGPSHFYLRRNEEGGASLFLGHTIDNRAVTPDVVRETIEIVTADLSNTAAFWSPPAEAPETE